MKTYQRQCVECKKDFWTSYYFSFYCFKCAIKKVDKKENIYQLNKNYELKTE